MRAKLLTYAGAALSVLAALVVARGLGVLPSSGGPVSPDADPP